MTATQTPPQAAESATMQVARTLDALRRHRRLSDQQLADRAKMSRPQVEARRHGRTPCSVPDLARLAVALNVEKETFFLDADTAVRWVLDNRPSFLGAEGKAAPGGASDGDMKKPGITTLNNRTGPGRNRGRERKSPRIPSITSSVEKVA